MAEQLNRTWDGHPITPTPPYGAMIVVYRMTDGEPPQFLLLHRAHHGADYVGPWAWGPPSGARYPDEDIDRCAERELFEETGIEGHLCPVDGVVGDWPCYVLEARPDVRPRLSPEHDRFRWLTYEEAMAHIEPQVVRDAFHHVVRILQRH